MRLGLDFAFAFQPDWDAKHEKDPVLTWFVRLLYDMGKIDF